MSSLLNLLNLILDFLVALLELIGLSTQQVNIVVEAVVLLFCLDKSGHDFFNVRNAGGVLNLIKCILNDLYVSQILVHQLSFFLVRVDDLVQSQLQDDDWVGEFKAFGSSICSFLVGLVEAFLLRVDALVFFFELELKLLDLALESFFFFFVLGLKSNDLVVCLLSYLGHGLVILVLVLGIFLGLLDCLVIALALILGTGQLFSEHVDLPFKSLILGLGHVKSDSFVVDLLLVS